jgi:PAS domain S-box-containing protein
MSVPQLDAAVLRWYNDFAEQGIFTTDDRLVLTSWNGWLQRQTGWRADEVVGRPLFDVYPGVRERGLDERYREALEGRAFLLSHLLHGYLLPITVRDAEAAGPMMPQRARIAPLMGGDRIVGTITVIDDVSDRVASEHELRRQIDAQHAARHAAEQALRVKDEFLATLSHEIRTPLSAVLGWARLLTEQDLEPALVHRALTSIRRNAIAQARLIDDLLDSARIMSGKLRLTMQPVDLVAVTISAVDVLAPVIEAKRLVLRRSFDAHVPRVLGDPDRLQQIIWNLLSNAAKFNDPGGSIDVRLEQAGDRAVLSVTDTGKGISAEFLPHIFERFRQADASSSRREGGLGLGLALVRELVQLQGGAVRAHSPGPGQGATFVLDFPIAPTTDEDADDVRVQRSRPPSLRDLHVLLVEDDHDGRDLLTAILSASGARVTAASSAQEALEALQERVADGTRLDVIVSDIGMASEDGYTFLRKVRALPASAGGTLPAIAVTAYAAGEDKRRAFAAGFQAHVAKPVDSFELVTTISELVRAPVSGR